ncbi:hypothetical protein [Asticcacaulis sp. AND118]|uniref:hypothetical protein n=1 Tax=Asticcacaulis sp. AND118 TaxID=2840468 RepID=UPI001CFF5E95|nr:hypothetical protein [Asticcacaulis sp. AND118]UDF05080.1 hypothetical protein LH365_16955 [Asticcacaulis sp. AND118]
MTTAPVTYDSAFQSKIIALSLRDTPFMNRVEGLVKPDYFDLDKHLSETKEGDDQKLALRKLRNNGVEEAIYLYDGEPEAYDEAVKAAEVTHALGIKSFVALMPPKVDPGEADTHVILSALKTATQYTRISGLRLKKNNPYK